MPCSPVSKGMTGIQKSQVLETTGRVWSKEHLPLVEEDQIREYLCKFISPMNGPHGTQPWVLRQLADFIVRPFSIILE